jgi:diadenosine tetraphosphatase ApaH/serine/threonine PP2A family protein phosphatase
MQTMLAVVAQEVVVCGHTHVQFDRVVAGKRVVNPGSVGIPYEGLPGAYWALLGPAVRLKCTPYDVERAAGLILASRYPAAEAFARRMLAPPSAELVTEHFEKIAAERSA